MKQSSLEPVKESALLKETWIGQSLAIELTKQRLMSMANSAIPVLIYGKKGTGKKLAARMIHDYDKGMNAPFVIIDCQKKESGSLLQRIEEGCLKAEGGSLFIRDIDMLTETESNKLRMLLSLADMFNRQKVVRLITSTRLAPFDESSTLSGNTFIEWMHYHSFTVELPTLEDRADDVESLIKYYQQQIPAFSHLQVDESALMFLKEYQWSENVFQLKKYLDILASKKYLSTINRQVLLDISPNMACTKKEVSNSVIEPNFFQSGQGVNSQENEIQENSLIHFLTDKIPSTVMPRAVCNPTLDKAIAYLYNNFTQPISLDELANHVCISSSHLSYLFKNSLGLSFKQVLLLLRIVEAMKLLAENPNRQVTQICDDVGFCDLSFFIRKFKATVGVSPGIYRSQYGHVKTSPELLKVEEALSHPLLQFPVSH